MNANGPTQGKTRRSARALRSRAVGAGLAALSLAGLLAGCAGSGGDEVNADGTTTPTSPLVTDASTTTGPGGSPSTTEAPAITTTLPTTTTKRPTTTNATTTPSTTTTTAPPVEPPGPLQSGSRGPRTLALQLALKAQKYDPGDLDAKFGLKTTMAIWAYQALHGMPRDGVVSPELETFVLAKAPQPMLRPNLGPTHTEVDLTRQVLVVFRDGAPTLITHVSSGSQVPYCQKTKEGRNCGAAVTPLGVFRYERRIKGVRVAPLGELFDPVYFKGGFAVHGSPSVPNRPASHGCVRIPMFVSSYFQAMVADGETIEVFRS